MLSVTKHNKLNKVISYNQKRTFVDPFTTGAIAGVAVLSVGSFVNTRYRISKPDEYLVRTGLFIKDMVVSKQGFQWPFQTYRFIKMQPINFSFNLSSMSQEKLEFVLPCVFTIGPKNDIESIEKYARLLPTEYNSELVTQTQNKDKEQETDAKTANKEKKSNAQKSGQDTHEYLVHTNTDHLQKLVQGIIEGETRVLSASMAIEEIFSDRKKYKELLLHGIQDELNRFGLEVYNVNIKELQDTPGSEYFERVRQKKRSQAENDAKINIAEAQKIGDIGQKEREATTRQQVALLEAETVLKENEKQQEIEKSNADLAVVKNQAFQKSEVSKIEAVNAAKIREAELAKEVEQKRIAVETEKLRASNMSEAQVRAETNVKDAEGISNSLKLKSEAELYAEQRKAEGILAVYNAQSSGIQNLIASFDNDKSALVQYLMIDKGLYEKLANCNANAIKGLQPKIVQWNTTSNPAGQKGTDAIADIMKMLPPMLTTIHDQTGIKPADWIMNMSGDGESKGKKSRE
jgi:flotillin